MPPSSDLKHATHAERRRRDAPSKGTPNKNPFPPIRFCGHVPKSDGAVGARVVMFSGCKDSQESADVSDTGAFGVPVHAGRGGAGGACTNAMLRFLSDDRHGDTWVSLLVSMQSYLAREGYDQVPQLSVGHRDFKLTDPFSVLHPKCKGPGHLSGKTRAVFIGRDRSISPCNPRDSPCRC